jgi:hypothetical protein
VVLVVSRRWRLVVLAVPSGSGDVAVRFDRQRLQQLPPMEWFLSDTCPDTSFSLTYGEQCRIVDIRARLDEARAKINEARAAYDMTL